MQNTPVVRQAQFSGNRAVGLGHLIQLGLEIFHLELSRYLVGPLEIGDLDKSIVSLFKGNLVLR